MVVLDIRLPWLGPLGLDCLCFRPMLQAISSVICTLLIVLVLVLTTPWTLRDLCLRSFVQKGPECWCLIVLLTCPWLQTEVSLPNVGWCFLVIHSCASVLLANVMLQEDLQTMAAVVLFLCVCVAMGGAS